MGGLPVLFYATFRGLKKSYDESCFPSMVSSQF